MLAGGDPHDLDMDLFNPIDPHSQDGPSLLHLAMRKGHLPSLEKLDVQECTDLSVVAEAVRGPHTCQGATTQMA